VKGFAWAFAALIGLTSSPAFASANAAKVKRTCKDITFYSADEDPAGLNIRSGPGIQHRVLGSTRWRNLHMTAFDVLDSQNGWFKVKAIGEWDYQRQKLLPLESYGGIGWVSGKKLLVEYYAGETIFLHHALRSKSVQRIQVELEISGPQQLLACKSNWVKIQHSEITEMADDPKDEKSIVYSGWIDGRCSKDKHCPFLPTGGPWAAPPWLEDGGTK
jgi:hypothetical protein